MTTISEPICKNNCCENSQAQVNQVNIYSKTMCSAKLIHEKKQDKLAQGDGFFVFGIIIAGAVILIILFVCLAVR